MRGVVVADLVCQTSKASPTHPSHLQIRQIKLIFIPAVMEQHQSCVLTFRLGHLYLFLERQAMFTLLGFFLEV